MHVMIDRQLLYSVFLSELRCSLYSCEMWPCPDTGLGKGLDSCGSDCYSDSDIQAALNQGYQDYQDGNSPDDYPHQYEDYEGFSFPDPGPYYEFPILADEEVYTGGSPGADRVIFTGSGQYEGLITHTGASSYDGFVQCSS